MKKHELRDEIFNQKLTNQLLSFGNKIDLVEKFVQTIRPFADTEAIETFLEAIEKHYDEGYTITK